jgi:hypothetical protein
MKRPVRCVERSLALCRDIGQDHGETALRNAYHASGQGVADLPLHEIPAGGAVATRSYELDYIPCNYVESGR